MERRIKDGGRREREPGRVLSANDQELQQEKEQLTRRYGHVETQLGKEIQNERDQHQNQEPEHIQPHDQVTDVPRSPFSASYTCHVSGPGLSATANHPTHVIVELSDASGQPCSIRQNVTAELQSVDSTEPLTAGIWWWPWSKKTSTTVTMKSPSRYEVSNTALKRGHYKLHIQLDGSEVGNSPFNITVYPDPTQLGKPVMVATGLNKPYGIAINSRGEMVVSCFSDNKVSLLDKGGKEVQTYGSEGDRQDQMSYPAGVTVDSDDNVYVASVHKLQKFSRDGHLIKCVGRYGSKDQEFREPKGVRIRHGYVYVCDRFNNRVQVLDTDLNFIQTIGSKGSGQGEFNELHDLDFDSEDNAYISDNKNHRIQVIDTSGQFVKEFGQLLKRPTAVHVMGQFVYVSDWGNDRITVYQTSGKYVTSFGKHTYGITSDCTGLIYVPDFHTSIQLFQ